MTYTHSETETVSGMNRSFVLFKFHQEWNKGRVEAECEKYFLTTSGVERLNNGMSFGKYQYLGVDRCRGGAGQRSKSCPLQVERKDLLSPSRAKSRLRLGCVPLSKGDLEVSSSKGMTEMVWKWISSIGLFVVSIGKWISEVMLAARSLPIAKKRRGNFDRGGFFRSIHLLLMLLAPPRYAYTLAKSDDHIIRHESEVNGAGVWQESRDSRDAGRSLTNTSFLESNKAAHDPDCRLPLIFDWGIDNPYTYERQEEGEKPFTLAPGCEETQRCLFMPDDKIFNVITGGEAVFPTFQNLLSERSPSIEQVLVNSEIVFDDESVMHVKGIGTYKGPTGIGEYRIIPQFLVDIERTEITKYVSKPSRFSTDFGLIMNEKWYHLDQTQTVNWNFRWSYYPCSVVRMREDLEFPPEFAQAFSDSGKVDGKVESVCKVVMEHCTGELTQYNTTEECISYLGSLPHHDQTCQDAFGEYSAMGNSCECQFKL